MANKVILVGNVGSDPEVRSFNNGGRVANFSLATSERWKDKNTGEKREKTEWHNISITVDGLVSVAEQYVRKGMKLYVEGKMQTRKWQDQSGNDRYTTEVVLSPGGAVLEMLSNSASGDSSSGASPSRSSQQSSDNYSLDDDIPF